MWLFLVTEIMFFTALIGTYMLRRNPRPSTDAPVTALADAHDVHLVEWIGAINTFVLICSSFTVVLAHWGLGKGGRKATPVHRHHAGPGRASSSSSRRTSTSRNSTTTSCPATSARC